MKKIPVANVCMGEREAKAAYKVIRSGWLSMGAKVAEFEDAFRRKVRAKHAIAVNNGTSALHLVLMALGIKEGDEVIIPSLTFISTANVVLYQKAVPVLAECDPRTYNITPEAIEKRITSRTRAIIPVDMNGMPFDYDGVLKVARRYSLQVIADSAESLGAVYRNKKIGSVAPVHCFSFFPNKNVTTGEGGMITTDNDSLAGIMRMIRNQGQASRYKHVVLGYNYRMTEVQAAIGIEQLKRLDGVLREKERIAYRYEEAFRNSNMIETPFVPRYVTRHAWYMYAISVPRSIRDRLVKKLGEKGIDTRLSFPPIHSQPLYKKIFGYNSESCPVTYRAWQSLIDIPIWPGMPQAVQNYVIRVLLEGAEK